LELNEDSRSDTINDIKVASCPKDVVLRTANACGDPNTGSNRLESEPSSGKHHKHLLKETEKYLHIVNQ
jgi:hypothetical protein